MMACLADVLVVGVDQPVPDGDEGSQGHDEALRHALHGRVHGVGVVAVLVRKEHHVVG